MTVEHWIITTEHSGRRREIEIILYDKLADMRGAATKHDKATKGSTVTSGDEGYKHTLAVATGWKKETINADGTWASHPRVARIRFARGHTGANIVSHEVAHIVMWLYNLDGLEPIEGDLAQGFRVESTDLRDHFKTSNERFAYMMGDLFETVWELVGSA